MAPRGFLHDLVKGIYRGPLLISHGAVTGRNVKIGPSLEIVNLGGSIVPGRQRPQATRLCLGG